MKIIDLFPKQKRVVGYNTNTGKRTAYALKNEKQWQELTSDIWYCEDTFQLQKCRWYWAGKVVEDLWPDEWIFLAEEEFDRAKVAIEAWSAQQAE